MLAKILNLITRHKLVAIIGLLIIVIGGYFGLKAVTNKDKGPQYTTAAVANGTLIVSVSGSGQVAASEQIDVKPKVSGDITGLYVGKGDEVKAGKLLVKLDDTDFKKAVNNAATSLETANLELDRLLSPPDELTLLQSENSLAQAEESKQNAQDNLAKGYEDGFNNVASAFLDLPSIMAGLQSTLFSYDFSPNQQQQNIDYYTDSVKDYNAKALQYRNDAYNEYQIARQAYDQNFQDYKDTSRYSATSTISSLISQTYETTKDIAEAVKSANNLIQFYQDKLTEHGFKPSTLSSTHLSTLATYISKTNSQLASLLSSQSSLQNDEQSIINAERTIEEKGLSLANLKAGATELDIRAKKIAVQQQADALAVAQQNLADCSIVAPLTGIVADINVKKGDSVSSGTVVASIITNQQIAEISLNEVDAAKVKVDQKATLTFDALPDVSISGKVFDIDTIGTVSQGVVSYGVKIALDTQTNQVKPGMSVAVDIITDVRQNVLVVPNSAVKSQGNSYYVELMENNSPVQQAVGIGISNDTSTEIASGLKEGDVVITSTVSSNTSSSASSNSRSSQGVRIPGISSFGGGR